MNRERPTVLLALSPVVEQSIAGLLFGADAEVIVSGSVVELAALERVLADDGEGSEALLISADLPELSAGSLSRARSHGLRLVGIATDAQEAALLRSLAVDTVLTTPLDARMLRDGVANSATMSSGDGAMQLARDHGGRQQERAERAGTVLAVVGSRGAPGASELACSLAALAAERWKTLLVELDLLKSPGLALRLGLDDNQGSLLALLRAMRTGELPLQEFLERWLILRDGWSPILLAPPAPEQTISELDQAGAIRGALDTLAGPYSLVIADVGFLLEQPGGGGAVERCHREALVTADAVVLTLGAREAQLDAGLAQLDLLLDELGIAPDRIRVVCNGSGGPGTVARAQLAETLTVGLRERELAVDALLPWDGRALAKAIRIGLPLAAAGARGGYARALGELLEALFLPGAPVARARKRRFALPSRVPASARAVESEEVALPWQN